MTTPLGPRIRFGLRNFKAFRYLEDLEFRPLTLLVGANSTGKSSIFQSLLLLKQTSLAGPIEGALKFNGEFVKLGNFETIISDFDTKKLLEYRFEIAGPSPGRFDVAFGYDPDTKAARVMSASIRDESHDGTFELDFERRDNGTVCSYRNGNRQSTAEGLVFDKFWPTAFGRVDNILSISTFPHLDRFLDIRAQIENAIEYLGPVRADPRPFYPVEEEPILGARGEGAIPYLLRRRNDKVHYAASHAGDIREGTLLEAINDWLRQMQITTSLSIEPLESVAYTAAVRTPSVTGRSVNLAQVGFGISQLLPVLILGLKNPPAGFLLFEQPEIHLHPRLQGGLGDFLLGVARAGRTVVVETHSDHLVNRIRRRIAEDRTGELAQMVQILFVHAGTEDDPGSYVEPLSVDESGVIVNCPEDFFSENADDAFAILQARRSKRQAT